MSNYSKAGKYTMDNVREIITFVQQKLFIRNRKQKFLKTAIWLFIY